MDGAWDDGQEVACGSLPLGVLIYDDSIEGDRLLAQAANVLARPGLRLAGVVQSNIDRPGRRKCDMSLVDLTSGEEIAISEDRGEEARGCRLDVAAMAQACLRVERAVQAGADLLIINKFGKQEALGGGFRPVIAEALLSGVPVLVGVSRLNLDAFLDFAGGQVHRLAPHVQAVVDWAAVAARRNL